MNIYRRLGDQIGTGEARELAAQLVTWHDAMVKHLRVLGSRDNAQCAEACPHEDAESLWAFAQGTFGARARELAFLRLHGQPKRASTTPERHGRAAEMRL
jgi:hypothetical protein